MSDAVRLIGLLLLFGVPSGAVLLAVGGLIDKHTRRSFRRFQFLASGETGWLFVVGAVPVYLISAFLAAVLWPSSDGLTYEVILRSTVIGHGALAGVAWLMTEMGWRERLVASPLNYREKAVVLECLRFAADAGRLSDSEAREKLGCSLRQLRAALKAWQEFGVAPQRSSAALVALTAMAWVLSGEALDESEWTRFFSFSEDDVESVFDRWKSVHGSSS